MPFEMDDKHIGSIGDGLALTKDGCSQYARQLELEPGF